VKKREIGYIIVTAGLEPAAAIFLLFTFMQKAGVFDEENFIFIWRIIGREHNDIY